MTEMQLLKTVTYLTGMGAVFVGSRAVLQYSDEYESAIASSDFDFMIKDHPATVKLLLKHDFVKLEIESNYKDIATTDIYEKKLGETVIQIALKKPEFWEALNRIWEFLKANPDVYVNSFWKRRATKAYIKNNINFMLNLFKIVF